MDESKSYRRVVVITMLIVLSLVLSYLFLPPNEDGIDEGAAQTESTGNHQNTKSSTDSTSQQQSGEKPSETKLGTSGLPDLRVLSIPSSASVSTEHEALDIVLEVLSQEGFPEDANLALENTTVDQYGNQYFRFQQQYKGVPVYGTSMLLDVIEGRAHEVGGYWMDSIELDIEPAMNAEQAVRAAFDSLNPTEPPDLSFRGDGELVVYVATDEPYLAWVMVVSANGHPAEQVISKASVPGFLARSSLRTH